MFWECHCKAEEHIYIFLSHRLNSGKRVPRGSLPESNCSLSFSDGLSGNIVYTSFTQQQKMSQRQSTTPVALSEKAREAARDLFLVQGSGTYQRPCRSLHWTIVKPPRWLSCQASRVSVSFWGAPICNTVLQHFSCNMVDAIRTTPQETLF